MKIVSQTIQTQSRTEAGTTEARAVRKQGNVPAVVYGGSGDVVMFSIESAQLKQLLTTPGFFSKVHTLDLDGHHQEVIAKGIQLHPVTDIPLHVDFMRVTKDSKVSVSVSLSFINEDKSPGIKKGGALNIVLHALELVCSPHAIPEKLVVDLAGLDIHHTVHLTALTLPIGAKAANPERDHVVATIVAPSGMAQES